MNWWNIIRENATFAKLFARQKATEDLSDAEILRLVRDSFIEEAEFLTKPDNRNLLAKIKTHAAIEAYLLGEATPDDVRPYLECEQCRSIVHLCREILPTLVAENQTTNDKQQKPGAFTRNKFGKNRFSQKFSLLNWRETFPSWNKMRPAALGLATGFLVVPLALVFLWLWSPETKAIWRFGKEPISITNEKGEFGGRVEEITAFGKTGKYGAPTDRELSAIKDAADLLDIGLRTKNEALINEAAKAAVPSGYVITDYENEDGQKFLVLTEKPDARRGRGTFVFRRKSFDGKLIIVAPHAVSDEASGTVAYKTFSNLPNASAFFFSGSDTKANDDARAGKTVFNTVLTAVLKNNSICLAIHGYDENRAGREGYPPVMITSGAISAPYYQVLHAALRNEISKFTNVEIYDGKRFFDLAATNNRQTITAADAGAIYAHLEISGRLRSEASVKEKISAAIGNVLRDTSTESAVRFAQPASGDDFVSFAQIGRLPREVLLEHGNQTIVVSRNQLKNLKVKENELMLISSGNKRAAVHLRSTPEAEEGRVYIGGTIRRLLEIEGDTANIQITRLP